MKCIPHIYGVWAVVVLNAIGSLLSLAYSLSAGHHPVLTTIYTIGGWITLPLAAGTL